MGFGFEPPDHPPWEDDDAESEPAHVGSINQLTETSAKDEDEDEETPAWSFLHHIYLSIQVGPFVLVIGKPED